MIKFFGLTESEVVLFLSSIVIISISAIVLSGIVFSFYWTKDSLVSTLYKIMSIADVATGVNGIFFSILCFTKLRNCDTTYYHGMFRIFTVPTNASPEQLPPYYNKTGCHRDDRFVLPITYYTTVIVFRTTLIVNILLTITRTINIIFPFRRIQLSVVYVCSYVWVLLWSILAITSVLTPMEFGESYINGRFPVFFYTQRDTLLRLLLSHVLPLRDPSPQRWEHVLLLVLSYALPLLLMVICTVIQAVILNTKYMASSKLPQQKQMTITILILTTVALFCGLPYTLYAATRWESSLNFSTNLTISFFLGFFFPLLNSFLNPLILIVRGKQIRGYLGRSMNRSISTNHNATEMASFTSVKEEPRKKWGLYFPHVLIHYYQCHLNTLNVTSAEHRKPWDNLVTRLHV